MTDTATSATTIASAAPSPTAALADVSPFAGIVTAAVALVFVLGLAWLLLRALRRGHIGRGGDDGPRVLRAVSLGARERLVVVQHHDTEFLLGVTAANVSVIERRRIDDAPRQVEPTL